MTQEHPDFVTVCKGMGFFASHWSYTGEVDGMRFYEPWSTVSQHFATADEAERAAKGYAEVTGMEFKPWTRPYRTLEEAARYDAIYREEMQSSSVLIRKFREDNPELKPGPGTGFWEELERQTGYTIGGAGERATKRYMEEANVVPA